MVEDPMHKGGEMGARLFLFLLISIHLHLAAFRVMEHRTSQLVIAFRSD